MNLTAPSNFLRWSAIALSCFSLTISMSNRINAQDQQDAISPAADLPTAAEVMKKHIEKSGGQEAFDKIRNRVVKATLTIIGQGISIDLTTWSARPNKSLVKMDSELTGKVEKGSTGRIFWENSLMQGPVVHDGAQKALGLRDSTFERFVYWKKTFESAKCLGTSKVDDLACYEIELTPEKIEGLTDQDAYRPTLLYIDSRDYLIRKLQTVLKTEAGAIKVVAYPSDYKEVDGIQMAHKTRVELLGQKRMIEVKDVKQNVDLPANHFEPPSEVAKLIK